MINVLGIDPSLTHTAGWHAFGPLTGLEKRGFAVQTEKEGHAHPLARLKAIRAALSDEFARCEANLDPGLCLIEGYAFGAKCAREQLGELGGVVRLLAYERGWDVLIVPPTSLKAFVCGKGNAPKELMMLEVFKRFGHSASDNNDADARALLELGLVYARWLEGEYVTRAHADLCRKLSPWAAKAA